MKDFLERLRKGIANFSNFTALLVAVLCSVLCFGFAFVDMVEPMEDFKAKITGIFMGCASFLIILIRWKRFTFFSRIVSLLLVIFTAYFVFGNIEWLYSHWYLLFRK